MAILTDALIVKMTLIPALFTLLGEKTWYIPRWLDKLLPNITVEPPHDGEDIPRADRLPEPSEATSSRAMTFAVVGGLTSRYRRPRKDPR